VDISSELIFPNTDDKSGRGPVLPVNAPTLAHPGRTSLKLSAQFTS